MKDWFYIFLLGGLGLVIMGWFINGMMEIGDCERRGGVSVRSYNVFTTVCVHPVEIGD